MSWNNQVATKESSNLVSRAENTPNHAQISQAPILKLFNMIHKSAKLSLLLGIQNIAHNNELWDDKHHTLSLSGHSRYLETDTKMLSSFLKHLACFIKQHPLRECPIEHFPTILRVGSYVWNLLQEISESG